MAAELVEEPYAGGTTTIQSSTISGNIANTGAGLYATQNGTTTIKSSTISGNTASGNGGGVWSEPYAGGTTTIQSSTISGNIANTGAGLYATKNGTTTIQSSTISGNTASGNGGGVYAYNLNATTILNSTISGNTAKGNGGGIWSEPYAGGTTTIKSSTISGNTAQGNGGGIWFETVASGTTTIQNSTISGNAAGKGAGLYLTAYGTTILQNSTITGNTASTTAGGMYSTYSYSSTTPVSVQSTIIAQNIDESGSAPDIGASVGQITITNSLVGDNTGSGLTPAPVGEPDADGNLIGEPVPTGVGVIDPLLGPLANNGGPTQTCALLFGSPGIGGGSNPAGLSTDQRGAGFSRERAGNIVDMGAVQYQAVVTSLSPSSGPLAGGTMMTITGTDFTGATAVKFGTTAATNVIVNSATQITATSPGGTGTVDVMVVTPGGTSPVNQPADQFSYVAAPAVTGISPASGPLAGGTAVTITGTNLAGATAVKFGTTEVTTFTSDTDTQIVLNSPGGTGTVDVMVVTPGGTSPVNQPADQFSYVAAPAVTGISPASGPLAGGTAVTITGTNLAGATAVKFGTTEVTTFTSDTDTQIVLNSPGGTGTVDVMVVTPGGTSPVNQPADQFRLRGGAGGDGDQSGIGSVGGWDRGDHHGHKSGGRDGGEVRHHGGNHFYQRHGHPDRVEQPGGDGYGGRDGGYAGRHLAGEPAGRSVHVTWPAPAVTGISPASGPLAGGTAVTITGTNLAGATAVKFGTTEVTTFTSDTDTQIVLNSPAGTGTVDVTVVTPGGTSPVNQPADQFSYVAAPAVTGISPASGPLAGGTAVTITGTNLAGATAVKFGTTEVTTFTSDTDTQIVLNSPAGTGTVDVMVVTPGGTSPVNQPADQFSYVAAPAVTGISPASGPLAGGTAVTITGTNLAGATAVKFGTTEVTTFTSDTDTQIVLNSPAGDGYGGRDGGYAGRHLAGEPAGRSVQLRGGAGGDGDQSGIGSVGGWDRGDHHGHKSGGRDGGEVRHHGGNHFYQRHGHPDRVEQPGGDGYGGRDGGYAGRHLAGEPAGRSVHVTWRRRR